MQNIDSATRQSPDSQAASGARRRRSTDRCGWFQCCCGPAHRPAEQCPCWPGRRRWRTNAADCEERPYVRRSFPVCSNAPTVDGLWDSVQTGKTASRTATIIAASTARWGKSNARRTTSGMMSCTPMFCPVCSIGSSRRNWTRINFSRGYWSPGIRAGRRSAKSISLI